jgi:hypothetical protein
MTEEECTTEIHIKIGKALREIRPFVKELSKQGVVDSVSTEISGIPAKIKVEIFKR